MRKEVSNIRMDERIFKKIRMEVLKGWHTGREVDFEEAIIYHHQLPKTKISSIKLAKSKREGIIFLQPRAGVALIEKQIDLLKSLEKVGAGFVPLTIDNRTRENMYAWAEKGILESRRTGKSELNGFPAVNHGVLGCRKVVEAVNVPVEVRHGTPYPQLLFEITSSSGCTTFEGGAGTYIFPYSDHVSLEESIPAWQYVDYGIGLFEENGVAINRESFGPLTGSLVPPCISIAVGIIEALLAAEQGVKNITLGYGQGGNLIQDVAAIKAMVSLAEEYLHYFDYKDILITTAFHQWMGSFPKDEFMAAVVIFLGAEAGIFAEANKIVTKSIHEGLGVPNKEANVAGLKISKQAVNMLKCQKSPLDKELLREEIEMIKQETICILSKVIEIGREDVAKGVVLAFKKGFIDIPSAPNKHNRGEIIPVRDKQGAIRLLDTGRLPFTKNLIDFHKMKVGERVKSQNRKKADFWMNVDDIYAIEEGTLVGLPWIKELYENDED